VAADNFTTLPRTGIVALEDGDTVVATLSLSSLSQANFVFIPTVGSHTYTVVYLGDDNFVGSISSVVNLTVT
jgi:hypothetical protein